MTNAMQLEVKIDQEAVQQQLVQAIMNSTIGEEIQKAIANVLQSKGDYYNRKTIVETAVDEALRAEVRKLATELVESKRDEIRAQLQDKLTDEALAKMTSAAWAVMDGRLRAAE